ncbi:peptidoglycan DD-metalloendopeptidase family protein [Shewanella aegiceratis]|uniref:peptidoglycan DD-metalloendopeptidase family protein n=1 Tax=Shewanella aegiceratis TaxID=2864203 RepID=UPI001C65E1EA|nr:peptidoglycan DD-metalloendopeptidase family protein [Shewanella aegiceratis]QYJ83405.1 peptidoglycan DD-metalloendopeptidase family protein [Shewanella aegiceratis]
MGKIITLLKLLPRLHQIILSVLVMITIGVIFLPSDDAEASRSTNTSLTGKIRLGEQAGSGASGENATNDTKTNGYAYPVPLAFRTPEPPSADEIARNTQESGSLDLNGNLDLNGSLDLNESALTQVTDNPVVAEPEEERESSEEFTVRSGDTLAALFKRAGLSARDVYEITQLPKAKKNLLKIMPGEEIIIVKDDAGQLKRVVYHLDPISTLKICKDDKGYSEEIIKKTVENRTKFASATISSNFWNAGVGAGLTPNQIMQLATIFGWDIDFALDLRQGDNFAILFEEEYADGEFLRNGNILAAEFYNQGDRYTAVRYKDGNYYSDEGRSMRKAFLRSPVDFKYVSSSFNPRRLHPVTGQVKAHRGVDYVAAVGTPIKAAGKGRVIKSGYNQYNGNYVFIKHNETYTTKYLHLKKRKVKQGQTVKQGQIIGTLGSTGRVTGAHLHYEFIVNGVHRNPRTVKLPQSLPIDSKEKSSFLALSKQLMANLEQNKQVQLASQ